MTTRTYSGDVVSKGSGNVRGTARILMRPSDADLVQPGDVAICVMTTPDWLPMFERAGAIITESGGRSCHAAIVARTYGLPCIVGVRDIMENVKDGSEVLVDVERGVVMPMDLSTATGRSEAYGAAIEAGRAAAPELDTKARWASFGSDGIW